MSAKTYFHYKPEEGMLGPVSLTRKMIGAHFVDDDYGVYLVLMPAQDGGMIVIYVGRGQLKARLTAHITDTDGTHFYYQPLSSDEAGFREECRLFHLYGEDKHLDNQNHPPVPAGSRKSHPKCSELRCMWLD